MSERHDLAVQLVALRVLLDLLKDHNDATREYAKTTEFDRPGIREPAEMGGVTIGAVSVANGRTKWKVTDPDKWLRWVQENRPDEIVMVPTVRSSFTEAVIEDGGAIIPGTGELINPPGMEYTQGAATLYVKPTQEARQAVLNALGDAAVVLGLAERGEIEPSREGRHPSQEVHVVKRHHAEVYDYQSDFEATEWGWKCETCGESEDGYTRPDAADEDAEEHRQRIDPDTWRSAS